jgi:hypothetical protein
VVGYNVYRSTTYQCTIRKNRLPSSLVHRMKIVCWAVAALLLRCDCLNWVRTRPEFLLASRNSSKKASP